MSATSVDTVVSESRRGAEPSNVDKTLARARKPMAEAVGIDSHIDTIQRVMMGEDQGQLCCCLKEDHR